MSVKAVCEAAYASIAKQADAADAQVRMFGKEDGAEKANAREQLDAALGLTDFVPDVASETNVVELNAWVSRVNATMR